MVSLSRRTFLALAACFSGAPHLRALAAQPITTSLEDFLELSGRLLGRSKLNRDVGKVYVDALNGDPVSALHLATLADSSGNPTPEQAAMARTIIEWWYTGTYTIGGQTRLATHTDALIWEAMQMRAPGTCAGSFGAWSSPPGTSA